MEGWIAFARGPMFRAALAFMLLGLARHAVLTIWELRRADRRPLVRSLVEIPGHTLGVPDQGEDQDRAAEQQEQPCPEPCE